MVIWREGNIQALSCSIFFILDFCNAVDVKSSVHVIQGSSMFVLESGAIILGPKGG